MVSGAPDPRCPPARPNHPATASPGLLPRPAPGGQRRTRSRCPPRPAEPPWPAASPGLLPRPGPGPGSATPGPGSAVRPATQRIEGPGFSGLSRVPASGAPTRVAGPAGRPDSGCRGPRAELDAEAIRSGPARCCWCYRPPPAQSALANWTGAVGMWPAPVLWPPSATGWPGRSRPQEPCSRLRSAAAEITFCAAVQAEVPWSDNELGFNTPELMAGQGQVRLLPVQDQVEEKTLLVARVPQQPDQVILLVQRDQNVFDGVIQAK
jgi:hypothetical protein